MKIQGNYNSYSSVNTSPAFGNYVVDRSINRAVSMLTPKKLNGLYKLGANNGENLNNIVTAVGTAGVAPIFIRFNPLSDEDPKVKAYSALRQPLSACLALGVQLPVMTAYNHMLDKWAASGKVRRIDLSSNPPRSLLKAYAKAKHEQDIREFFALGHTPDELDKSFYKGRTKKQYIEDIINDARGDIFYNQKVKLRNLVKEDKPITTSVLRNEKGKVVDWFHPTKLEEIKDLEYVRPDELNKARNAAFPEVLREMGVDTNDRSLFEIKMDWTADDPYAKFEKMKKGEIEIPDSLKDFKKSAVKKALKKSNVKYSDFKKRLESAAEEKAINFVKKDIAEEIAVKVETSKAFNKLSEKFSKEVDRILNDPTIRTADKKTTIDKTEIDIVNSYIENIKEQISKTDDAKEIKKLNRVIEKLKDKKINEIRYHGSTYDEVARSVKVKRWLKAEINRREGVFKNFKKLSGLLFGLAILPFTCGLLNWAYPRFMEKFFPKLCDAKAQAKKEQEGK